MRRNLLSTLGVTGFAALSAIVSTARPAGQAPAATTAAPVPAAATGKTMFWKATELQARWKENEALRRINSRLFNGPTNISANVRIVLPDDPVRIHETTADLWIVTEGTAVAETDGKAVETGGVTSISGAVRRPVKAGDVLYVPPGVPHHYTDVRAFRAWLIRFDTKGLVRSGPAPTPAAPAAEGAARPAATPPAVPPRPVPDLALDKTMFWEAAEIDARWKENEANKRANSRIYNGPANISANVRIVLPGDPPLTHVGTADLWLVTAGEAVARTDGELVTEGGARTIRNALSRPVGPGDLLYVPPGVPHHFTDLKGFRAWLIRFDVEGWAQSIAPPAPAVQPR
jgi:mannose-6-phosphate isomerase-like protein (cupin superfamily)